MFYPVMLDIYNRKIVIVGGGRVAHRKSRNLLSYGGRVTIIAPSIIDEFQELEKAYPENLNFIYNKYDKKHIERAFLVIAATSSRQVNGQISQDCEDLNILVNVVDSRGESDFITPSIISNDNLTIAISTMGSFPYLSKKIRMEMEENYRKYDGEYMKVLEDVRAVILQEYRDRSSGLIDYSLELEMDELKRFLKKLKEGRLE